MSDTNINAYYDEVAEAEKALAHAENNLQVAKERLAQRKAELGMEEVDKQLIEVADIEEADEPIDPSDRGITTDGRKIIVVSGDEPSEPLQPGDVVAPTAPELPEESEVSDES